LVGVPEGFRVGEGDRGQRLDQFVQRALSALPSAPSRALVQRWILAGAVRVNGEARKPSDAVRSGDTVEVVRPEEPRSAATPEAGIAFDIVHVDDALVVVNKPAGLVVHPAPSCPSGTLVNGLLARGYFDADLIDTRDAAGFLRPGVVHRIDKGTSGLLVVARTPFAREALKEQLMAHTVLREYDALAEGDVKVLVHDTPYGRHPKDRLRFTSQGSHPKRAVTRVAVVERFGVATHVRCTLQTGRTHQIRVHLAESGTPLLGDTLYGKLRRARSPEVEALGKTLGHQALHARLLGFTHPVTREAMRFEAPPPEDFLRALSALGSAPSPLR
jgi:23S rRNA pseudouridine1911/1915/1917 synthase